jgi:Tetracyclin repressor-like, C-terminal domain
MPTARVIRAHHHTAVIHDQHRIVSTDRPDVGAHQHANRLSGSIVPVARSGLLNVAEPPGDEADPTDLRGCLIGVTEQVIDMFVGPKALVLPRVLIEASQYPPRFDDMVQNIVRARFGTIRTIIQAAADRGELPARTPPDLIIDAIMGRVISLIVLTPGARRATINAERDRYAGSITDFVLRAIAGLARDPRVSREPLAPRSGCSVAGTP